MKITGVDIFKFDIKMIHPIRVPIGILDAAHNVAIRINTDGGICGWGEASPFEPITGDTQLISLELGKKLAASIVGSDPLALAESMQTLRPIAVGHSSILSAFDSALHDIAGKAEGVPVYELLGGTNRTLRSDFTVGMQDTVEETLAIVDEGFANGFDAVKLKVGRPGLEDVDFVTAVRNHCTPDTLIKIDSNQGWDYETAYANLHAMEKLNLQYSEQPVAADDYASLKRLRENTAIPICADESVFDDNDAAELVSTESVDYLNIKLGKSGGIETGLKINSIAEAAGKQCMVGCFAESRMGLTAAAHLAIARPNICFIDLDSAYDLKIDPIVGGGLFNEKDGGRIYISDEPGLGAALNQEFIDTCHWATAHL
jgi:L-alanine-DL-glutamate epimerase-like enolase superfamily enzyme